VTTGMCITKPPQSFHPLHEVQQRYAYVPTISSKQKRIEIVRTARKGQVTNDSSIDWERKATNIPGIFPQIKKMNSHY
jgi:hypothetical protein